MMNDHEGNKPKWWQWLLSGLMLVVGVVLVATGVGSALGVSLLVAGGSMMASNIMSAAGVNGKVASIISSVLNIVAGVALCFTPFASMGASMIGSGIGGIAGGFISEALGGSFEVGSMIGSIVGGIIGGQVYKGVQAASATRAAQANTSRAAGSNSTSSSASASSTSNQPQGPAHVIGKAHGSVEHQAEINRITKEMVGSGEYSKIYLNRALKTAGLNGSQRPDIIGIKWNGTAIAYEIASKTQTTTSIAGNRLLQKVINMSANNPGVVFKDVIWLFG